MPATARTEEVGRVLKADDYLTDGKKLVLVKHVDENGVLVEDASDERPFRLQGTDLADWSYVPLRVID